MTTRPLTEKGRQALEKALHVPITRDDDGRLPFRKPVLDTLVAHGYLAVGDNDPIDLWFITSAGKEVLRREIPRFLHARPHRNYTTNPALAARGEPEAVDDTYLDEFGLRAEQQRARTLHERELEVERLSLAAQVAKLEADAAAMGADISRQLASIHARVRVARRRLEQKKTDAA